MRRQPQARCRSRSGTAGQQSLARICCPHRWRFILLSSPAWLRLRLQQSLPTQPRLERVAHSAARQSAKLVQQSLRCQLSQPGACTATRTPTR